MSNRITVRNIPDQGIPVKNDCTIVVGDSPDYSHEVDPTVPEWAKQPEKPTYTAEEVGALSQEDLQSAVDAALSQAKASGEFDGADGRDGKDGVDGIDGEDGIGVTKTEINSEGRLVISYSNGETEILDKVVGTDGKDGEKGDTGPKGDKGDRGEQGEEGYTPVKGTDYFTEADKAELVDDVIAKLPVYDGSVV